MRSARACAHPQSLTALRRPLSPRHSHKCRRRSCPRSLPCLTDSNQIPSSNRRAFAPSLTFEATNLASTDGVAALVEIGGALAVASNARLVSLVLPQLESISGPMNVASSVALEEVSLPALTSVGGLNDTSLNFADLAMLREIELPSLPETGSGLRVSDVGRLQEEASLQLDFGALTNVGGSLTLVSNPTLTNLGGFPVLVAVSGFVVQGNSALPTCLATDFAEQLGVTSPAISGNGTDECSP